MSPQEITHMKLRMKALNFHARETLARRGVLLPLEPEESYRTIISEGECTSYTPGHYARQTRNRIDGGNASLECLNWGKAHKFLPSASNVRH